MDNRQSSEPDLKSAIEQLLPAMPPHKRAATRREMDLRDRPWSGVYGYGRGSRFEKRRRRRQLEGARKVCGASGADTRGMARAIDRLLEDLDRRPVGPRDLPAVATSYERKRDRLG